MLTRDTVQERDKELAQTVARHVRNRTGGRVRGLEVTRVEGRLIVRATAPTYYVKQLAIQAVTEVLGRDNAANVVLDILVGAADPPAPAAVP